MKRARWAMAWALGAALGVMAASPRAEEIDRVVATLDEEAIFLSEVEAHARPLLVESAAQPGTAEQRAERRRTILRQSLDRMLNDRLMRRAATRAHTTVTSEEVDEFIERLAAERGATPAQGDDGTRRPPGRQQPRSAPTRPANYHGPAPRSTGRAQGAGRRPVRRRGEMVGSPAR